MASNESTLNRYSRVYAVRVPQRLQTQLESIAARDASTFSGTIRRLLAAGLRAEDQEAQRAR